jgi:ubiquinone biosynthesis protein
MLKTVKIHLAIMVGLCLGALHAVAGTPAVGMYLSFEEKVMAGYALLAHQKPTTEKTRIYQRAMAYAARTAAQGVQTSEVKNFNEFLTQFRGEWPNSGDLGVDLERIESLPAKGLTTYTSPSPRVQRQIDDYLKRHVSFLLMAAAIKTAKDFSLDKVPVIGEDFIAQQMAAFNTIGEKIATAGMSMIKDTASRITLQTLFNQYYSTQTLDSKKQMIAALLNVDLNLSDEAKLELMIQNSGPQFQKLLQLVARQSGLPEDLKKTFKKLESAVRAVPWWQVEQLLTAEKQNYSFSYFERKPLGVGTMAQVHRAKILWNGHSRDVVVRFIKPNMEARVVDDQRILTEVAKRIDQNPEYRQAGGPLMTPLVKDITDTVRAELDQDATIERQILAKKAYEVEKPFNTPEHKSIVRFHVPDITRPVKDSKLMVQEMVLGRSLDKEAAAYKDSIPFLKKGIVEAMAEVWSYQMVFDTGFYHSDLHQGNFLVSITDDAIVVNILDYGMGGVLNEKMRQQVMVLGVSTALKDAQLITNAFWEISNQAQNTFGKEQLLKLVQEKLAEAKRQGKSLGTQQWTGWLSDQGLKIPYDLINLSRGMLIMDNSLQDAGSTKTISSIGESLAKANAGKVVSGLRGSGLISKPDLIRIGNDAWQNLRAKTSQTKASQKAAAACKALF